MTFRGVEEAPFSVAPPGPTLPTGMRLRLNFTPNRTVRPFAREAAGFGKKCGAMEVKNLREERVHLLEREHVGGGEDGFLGRGDSLVERAAETVAEPAAGRVAHGAVMVDAR